MVPWTGPLCPLLPHTEGKMSPLSVPVPHDSLSQWFLQIPPNSKSRDMHNLSVMSPWRLGGKMCLGAHRVPLQRWGFPGRGCGLCRRSQGHLASYIVSLLPAQHSASTSPACSLNFTISRTGTICSYHFTEGSCQLRVRGSGGQVASSWGLL